MKAPLSRIAFAVFVAAVFGASPEARAAENPAMRTITVSGEGEASGKPDQARLSAGVKPRLLRSPPILRP